MDEKPNRIPPAHKHQAEQQHGHCCQINTSYQISGNTGQYLNSLCFVKGMLISFLQELTFPINLCSQTLQEYLETFFK